MTAKSNLGFRNEYEAFFLGRNDTINRWGNAVSSYQLLPGLVGFWPFSSVQRSTGNAYDLSGQGRTLTYNGNPVYNRYNSLVPYLDFDGIGDYLSRADETDLDILGTETQYANPGLTLGCWVRWSALGAATGLLSKAASIGTTSFYLEKLATDTTRLVVSTDGTTLQVSATSAVVTLTTAWYLVIGRFVPSTSVDVYLNNVKTSNTTSIIASIFNSTSAFEIGRALSTNLMTGDIALPFLCATALPDSLVGNIWQQTRYLFGV